MTVTKGKTERDRAWNNAMNKALAEWVKKMPVKLAKLTKPITNTPKPK